MDLPGRSKSVPIVVGRGVLGNPPASLPRWSSGVLIVDRAVDAAYADGLTALMQRLVEDVTPPLVLESGEETKDATRLVEMWAELDRRELDRKGVVVVAGGGSILDLGVFLAATWLRGVDCVVVPTTLLAQVDAGLGGKCGVNLGCAKNQVGAIWQPRGIVADVDVLHALPDDEVRSGMGEVVKTALLAGGPLLEDVRSLDPQTLLEGAIIESIIARCLQYKASIVAADEREGGRRAILNLGHTVGHVLESLALDQGTPVPHGVAVAVGILAEATTFADDVAVHDLCRELLDRTGLPRTLPVAFDDIRARALLTRDKKRDGAEIITPMLATPGDVRLESATIARLLDACRAAVETCAG